MVTHRDARLLDVERPRPQVRSNRLVHRGTVVLGADRQVLTAGPRGEAASPDARRPEAEPERRSPHKRFRFARPLIAATVLSASLARAEGSGGGLSGEDPQAEVLAVGEDLAVAPRPEELELSPRLGQVGAGAGVLATLGEALGAKVDGTKENPYVARGLVKRVPRAKRMAWKRIYEEGAGYDKVSDLKGNPYE